MGTFLVTGCGHSGTKLLSLQLGAAPGWRVEHEPDGHILSCFTAPRFEGKNNYGEVNSFLLASARFVPVTHKAVLLRNPYDIVRSIVSGDHRRGTGDQAAINYVREGIATLNGLIRDGFQVILFRGITRSKSYVLQCAQRLGIETLTKELIRTRTRVNPHRRPGVTVDFDKVTREEFDYFVYRHNL